MYIYNNKKLNVLHTDGTNNTFISKGNMMNKTNFTIKHALTSIW